MTSYMFRYTYQRFRRSLRGAPTWSSRPAQSFLVALDLWLLDVTIFEPCSEKAAPLGFMDSRYIGIGERSCKRHPSDHPTQRWRGGPEPRIMGTRRQCLDLPWRLTCQNHDGQSSCIRWKGGNVTECVGCPFWLDLVHCRFDRHTSRKIVNHIMKGVHEVFITRVILAYEGKRFWHGQSRMAVDIV